MFNGNRRQGAEEVCNCLCESCIDERTDVCKGYRGYPSAAEQLKAINRQMCSLSSQIDTLFESIAKQINFMTKVYLIHTVCQQGHKFPNKYLHFFDCDEERLKETLKQLSCAPLETIEADEMILTMLSDGLSIKIVCLESSKRPLHFPDDHRPIDDKTFVIVFDRHNSKYYPTSRIGEKPDALATLAQYTRTGVYHGSALNQLAKMNRTLVPVADDGNSLFESIALQRHPDRHSNAEILRALASHVGTFNIQKYHHLTLMDKKNYLHYVNDLAKDEAWSSDTGHLVLTMLSDSLNVPIIVVRSNYPQLQYGDQSSDQCKKDTIVIVQSDLRPEHYDATCLCQ